MTGMILSTMSQRITGGYIYHYEADGILYLKRSSWYKWAEQTNTVVLKDRVEEFPFVYSEGLIKKPLVPWFCQSASDGAFYAG